MPKARVETPGEAAPKRTEELPSTWRRRAAELRSYAAAEGAATAYERAASELERAQAESSDAVVSLNDGARLSGYSPDHLARLIKAGRIENQGTRYRPRLKISDLPRKPKQLTPPSLGRILGAQ